LLIHNELNTRRENPLPKGIGLYTTFLYFKYKEFQIDLTPLLLEGCGEENKLTRYIPLIPAFSLKGEGADTCEDTYAISALHYTLKDV